ncbi:hypothetical protein AB6M97_01200 [Streptococcus hillyeri]|uniref:Membrane associated protein n=1 Tax=Streptococcus hillyeri TaxID=2282420 RepID=A0A3L9DUC9_9STRE|nr:hypothetical protein [Streptococcus hillyeri]RLY03964.1 hypothetical protein EAF07_04055 [Streptococcus hillyeri]
MSHHHSNPNNTGNVFLKGIVFLILLAVLIKSILPIVVVGAIGYGVYRLATRQASLEKRNTSLRLQDLRDDIHQTDSQVKLLEKYLSNKDYGQYTLLAREVLPQVEHIRDESEALKDKMDLNIYKRVNKKATDVITDIQKQLKRLDIAPDLKAASAEEKSLLENAPELLTIYRNIQRDHGVILDKIEQMDNKAELLAIHESEMNRFKDILSGYLKIKQSPKDFYNADERLSQAKATLEKFDLSLDETLRKLNEQELKDFEISMRMMEDTNTGSDIY